MHGLVDPIWNVIANFQATAGRPTIRPSMCANFPVCGYAPGFESNKYEVSCGVPEGWSTMALVWTLFTLAILFAMCSLLCMFWLNEHPLRQPIADGTTVVILPPPKTAKNNPPVSSPAKTNGDVPAAKTKSKIAAEQP